VKRASTIAYAGLLDLLAGDPLALPHPVAAIGAAVRFAEPRARRRMRDERFAGAVVTLAIVGAAAAAGAILERAPLALRALAAASTLACGSLLDHAAAVRDALESGDVDAARRAVSRIVGRDVADLTGPQIARAAIEALAESTCDGVVAPLLFLAAFGLPGAFAYKAINTLDSLIGHIEPPYRRFGEAAARLDDLANLLPARVSAALISLAALLGGGNARAALGLALRDGLRHRSPNAGVSEAAMAGALGVRLGGRSSYDGIPHDAPVIGAEYEPPSVRDVRRAMQIVFIAGLLSIVITALPVRDRR